MPPPSSPSPLGSQIVGADQQVLLLHLPSRVTDEWVGPIEQEVRTRLPRIDKPGLVLDFTAVELVNSIGITCLLQVEELCRKRGGKAVLAGLSPGIRGFLKQLKLDKRFEVIEGVEEAVKRVG